MVEGDEAETKFQRKFKRLILRHWSSFVSKVCTEPEFAVWALQLAQKNLNIRDTVFMVRAVADGVCPTERDCGPDKAAHLTKAPNCPFHPLAFAPETFFPQTTLLEGTSDPSWYIA